MSWWKMIRNGNAICTGYFRKRIGQVTATEILITKNESKEIKEANKFACYSGVAPFTKESGILKGKAKLSHMTNKSVKTLLHLPSLVAIRRNKDFNTYYKEKSMKKKEQDARD